MNLVQRYLVISPSFYDISKIRTVKSPLNENKRLLKFNLPKIEFKKSPEYSKFGEAQGFTCQGDIIIS